MYNAEDFRVHTGRGFRRFTRTSNYGRYEVKGGTPDCCLTNDYDFNLFPAVQYTKLGTSQIITTTKIVAKVTAYGYTNGNVPSLLSIRGTQGVGEQGMGMWDDQFSNSNPDNSVHQLDNQHYIQLDVSGLKPYQTDQCGGPTLTIGSLQSGGGFEIGGSNTPGQFGTQLFTYISNSNTNITKTVSLFNPAGANKPTIYNFISIRAFPAGAASKGGNVVLVNLTVNSCSTQCNFASTDCAGVCGGTSILDCAGNCYDPKNGGKPTKVADCAGFCGGNTVADCNGVCGGNSVPDCQGVCGGSSVPDCNGVCGGTAVPDCQRICGGTTQVDCAGICNGTSTYDCAGNCYDPKKGPPPKTKDCAGNCGGNAYPDAGGKCVTPDCVWQPPTNTFYNYNHVQTAGYHQPRQEVRSARVNRYLPKNN